MSTKTTLNVICPKANFKNLNKALAKRATGYRIEETVEEYSLVDSKEQLVKKRVTTKDIPPDLDAIEILLNLNKTSGEDNSLKKLSDEELEMEKQKLILLINNLPN